MKYLSILCFFVLIVSFNGLSAQENTALQSPNKHLSVKVYLQNGKIYYDIFRDQEQVLGPSALGILTKSGDLSKEMKLSETSKVKQVKDVYQLLNGKRKNNIYLANQQSWKFQNSSPLQLKVVFQVSDDGVAFRYQISSK
jgi:hypothetical protein